LPTLIKYSEPELVRLLKGKDEQAFGYLYDNYGGALFGVILKVIGEQETARDILQESLVKIWRNMNAYEESRGKLFTWMLHIARNTAIDTLRSRQYRQDRKNQVLDNTVDFHTDSLSVTQKVDHLGLNTLVEGLSEEHRKIIDLAYFKGYTREEIAIALDMPLGTVKTRVRNALVQLKAMLK